MKKHNEGYSLVLVLVVLTVLSLVASFILSFSLRNLQSQTASVERMEQKYAAAGEIEKIVAQLEAFDGTDEIELPVYYTDDGIERTLGVTDNKLVIEVYSGNVGIKCELELVDGAPTLSADELKILIDSKPTEVKYISYEQLAREVTE